MHVHNSTVQENKTGIGGGNKDYAVVATINGPNTLQKIGTSATIYYTVTNNGKNAVYNVEAWSQDFSRYIGTLGPGQTRKYTYKFYIPTDKDLAYMGGKVKSTSPMVIWGIYVSFKDDRGVSHRIQSNSIAIKFK